MSYCSNALDYAKFRGGPRTYEFLPDWLGAGISQLQESGGSCDGAGSGRGADDNAGRGIEFDRADRQTHVREHAFAVDGFSDHRWREAGSPSRYGIRIAGDDAGGVERAMGSGLEMHVRRAGGALGHRPGTHGRDSQAATFGDAGDQSPVDALCVPRRANRVSFEAFRCCEVDDADDAAEKAAGLISGIRCGWFSPFRLRLLVKSARWLPWWSSPLLQRV